MKKIMWNILVMLFFLSFHSCGEVSVTNTATTVNEWMGRKICFPVHSVFTVKGYEKSDYNVPKSDYKIVSYVDTAGCLSCKLELSRWEGLMHEIENLHSGCTVSLLLYVYPKKKDVENLLYYEDFIYPICIDVQNEFDEINNLPKSERLRTFLLNKDDEVIAIGNPTYNIAVKELYFDVIK